MGERLGVTLAGVRELIALEAVRSDLVLIATTQTVDAGALRTGLASELRQRGTTPTAELSLPSEDWHSGYRKLAVSVPGFSYVDAAEAIEIVNDLVGPAIAGMTTGTWDPERLQWASP